MYRGPVTRQRHGGLKRRNEAFGPDVRPPCARRLLVADVPAQRLAMRAEMLAAKKAIFRQNTRIERLAVGHLGGRLPTARTSSLPAVSSRPAMEHLVVGDPECRKPQK